MTKLQFPCPSRQTRGIRPRRPAAMRYGGHQFGVWNPGLGDGRGRLRDLHLKGSGRTAFSETSPTREKTAPSDKTPGSARRRPSGARGFPTTRGCFGKTPGGPREKKLMDSVNPLYVLRNRVMETVIKKAEGGDFSEIDRARRVFENPFDARPGCEDLRGTVSGAGEESSGEPLFLAG